MFNFIQTNIKQYILLLVCFNYNMFSACVDAPNANHILPYMGHKMLSIHICLIQHDQIYPNGYLAIHLVLVCFNYNMSSVCLDTSNANHILTYMGNKMFLICMIHVSFIQVNIWQYILYQYASTTICSVFVQLHLMQIISSHIWEINVIGSYMYNTCLDLAIHLVLVCSNYNMLKICLDAFNPKRKLYVSL